MTNEISDELKRELYQIIQQANTGQTKELQESLKKATESVKEQLTKADEKVEKLQSRVLYLERKIRRNNIIIFGLDISKNNLIEDTITKLNSLLETTIVKSDLNNIYSIGRADSKFPVVLEFVSFIKKHDILKCTNRLKNTGVSIANDLSPEDRKEHQVLVNHLKKAKNDGYNARIQGNKLIVNGTSFSPKELLDLEQQNTESEREEDEELGTLTHQSIEEQSSILDNIIEKGRRNKQRRISYSPQNKTTVGGTRLLRRKVQQSTRK